MLWVVLVRSFVLVVAVVFICGVVDYHFGRGGGLDWSMGSRVRGRLVREVCAGEIQSDGRGAWGCGGWDWERRWRMGCIAR